MFQRLLALSNEYVAAPRNANAPGHGIPSGHGGASVSETYRLAHGTPGAGVRVAPRGTPASRHKEDLMTLADCADFGPVGLRWDDHTARTLNGFRNKCRDPMLAQLFDFLFEFSRDFSTASAFRPST